MGPKNGLNGTKNSLLKEKKNKSFKNIDFQNFVEKLNPIYSHFYSKKSTISSSEMKNFNTFCIRNINIKMNFCIIALSLIYLILCLLSFLKYENKFFGISYLILIVLNILIYFFKKKLKKSKYISENIIKNIYYLSYLLFIILFYEFLQYLNLKKITDKKELVQNFIFTEYIDIIVILLTYFGIFLLYISSYSILVIAKLINIILIILIKKSDYNLASLVQINNNINITDNLNIYNNNITENKNFCISNEKIINLSLNLLLNSDYIFQKKIYYLIINALFFTLFYLIERFLRQKQIFEFKLEKLISIVISNENNILTSLRTKKIIFKENEVINNEFKNGNLILEILINNYHEKENDQKEEKLGIFQRIFFCKKNINNKQKQSIINESTNLKLINNNNNISIDENRKDECLRNQYANNVKNEEPEVNNLHKEKSLSESIDEIINNPDNTLAKKMESLLFTKDYVKIKEEDNFIFQTIDNKNDNTKNNFYSNNGNKKGCLYKDNNLIKEKSEKFINKNEYIKTSNNQTVLFDDIKNLLIKRSYILSNKNGNTSGLNNSKYNRTINFSFKSKIDLNDSLSTTFFFGNYINCNKRKEVEEGYDKNLFKFFKIFFLISYSKKITFVQFFFEDIVINVKNLKNFLNHYLPTENEEESKCLSLINKNLGTNTRKTEYRSYKDYCSCSFIGPNNINKEFKEKKLYYELENSYEKVKCKNKNFKKNLQFFKTLFYEIKSEFNIIKIDLEKENI